MPDFCLLDIDKQLDPDEDKHRVDGEYYEQPEYELDYAQFFGEH